MSEKTNTNLEEGDMDMAFKGENRIGDDTQKTSPSGFGQIIGLRRRGGQGRGYRRGRGEGRRFRYRADNLSGNCICPSCGHIEKHEFGQPCFEQTCPNCGVEMLRQ